MTLSTDNQILAALDFKVSCACGSPALFMGQMSCCMEPELMCRFCRAHFESLLRRMWRAGDWVHPACGRPVTRLTRVFWAVI